MYLVYTNFNFHFLEDYFKRDEDVSTVSIRGIPTTMTKIFEILLFPDSPLSSKQRKELGIVSYRRN